MGDRGIYDNMKTAVETIFVSKGCLYNRRFMQMCSHCLVDPVACPRLQMLDLRRPSPPRLQAGMFAFPAGGLSAPKVLAEHRLLMSALDPFADVNRVSRQVRKVPPPYAR
jgi:hypothetical protein